ncbi:hypothetical protein GWK08_10755 [Leptobacterium flavescens]|uniref:Uncharacterized protein n=1 Tax=Leptobacterium flavescens TaxID=472055 RepID=A0A6P0UN38_9FLAO|nr:hypothetical protein [Leptobacterium flavescens]NER13922.1 hypothetical protein [Leptobacterium flavescens]
MKQSKYREEVKQLLEKAYDENLITWNDGLVFNEFIPALWRALLKHEEFKEKAVEIQTEIGEQASLELLAAEINLFKK